MTEKSLPHSFLQSVHRSLVPMRGIFGNGPLFSPKPERPTFNNLPMEILILIINAGVTPLWPEDPQQRENRKNWMLVDKCWKAAIEDQTVAICTFPTLCAHATEEAIMKQVFNLDLQYHARLPKPHHFLQDPDLHYNHDLCELDAHNLVELGMRHLLVRGFDNPASVLLAMDAKYDRFDLAKMGAFHYTARRSTMTMLRSHGLDINMVHPLYKDTALLCAIIQLDDDQSVMVVRRLLDHGANIDSVDSCGNLAVVRAARENKVRTTKLLLERGARAPFHFQGLAERVAAGSFGTTGGFDSSFEIANAVAGIMNYCDPDGNDSW